MKYEKTRLLTRISNRFRRVDEPRADCDHRKPFGGKVDGELHGGDECGCLRHPVRSHIAESHSKDVLRVNTCSAYGDDALRGSCAEEGEKGLNRVDYTERIDFDLR